MTESRDDEARQRAAKDHLWMHFTRHSTYDTHEVPTIVRGDGVHIWDAHGNKYIDGLAGLFVVQAGHGRTELAEAAAKQAAELAFFPLWSYAHPGAIDLAERIAGYAPGDLNRVFFTTGGGEAVESAWKLAKQFFKLTGKPTKHKVISRAIAYHGTPQGALSITGLPGMKAPFEPLVPSTFRVPNTNFYRAPEQFQTGAEDDEYKFGQWAANRIAEAIEFEGPDTVAAVFLEPVQNSGGCFPPPPGYFERVREICDEYDVLLVSDEVICAFGRLGHMFAAERYDYQPDIITCAKGLTSGYSPLGAMVATDRLFEPFAKGDTSFVHGYTFGGHPVSTAVAMANLDIFEREQLNEHVRETEGDFRATPGEAATTCRSSATSAATGTSTASSWSRTRPPGRPSTRRSASACCGASSPAPCSRPASTAAPTTAATRSSSSPHRWSPTREPSTRSRPSSATSSPGPGTSSNVPARAHSWSTSEHVPRWLRSERSERLETTEPDARPPPELVEQRAIRRDQSPHAEKSTGPPTRVEESREFPSTAGKSGQFLSVLDA